MDYPQGQRNRLAQRVMLARDACADAVTYEIYLEAAACARQFGESGRQHCREDLGYHIQFLAAGLEAGSPRMFADYLRWTDGVLAARGIRCEPAAATAARLARRLEPMLNEAEREMLAEFMRESESAPQGEAAEEERAIPEELRLTREAYVGALLAADRKAALTIAKECLRAGFSPVELYVEVLAASLHRVGGLWQRNSISVAHEHIATAITQMVVAALYPELPRVEAERGRMVVTGVAGEMHQVGATLLADSMEAQGWKVSFLGSNVPTAAVLDTIERTAPDVLCISTTLAMNLPAASQLIAQVRERFGERAPRIVVGGSAFAQVPEGYVAELGVTRMDLRGAVQMLCAGEAAAAG